MGKTTTGKGAPKTVTRLAKGTSFKGTLRFRESLRVSGSFEGRIESGGFLHIDESAEVRADVEAETVVIAGTVRGDAHARQRLELLPTARVYGNVKAASARISDGVVLEGKCEMIRNANAVDIFAVPANQLRRTIQGVFEGEP